MPHYLARLPGGKAVIVSNLGLVVDAETGKILIEKLPALPEARGGWGKGYVCGLGNLIAKSNGGGFETWQLKVGSTGILEVAAQSLMQFKKGEGPFALSDQLVVVIANRGGPAGHCLVDPVSGEVKGTVDYNTGATPTIAGKTLIFSEEDVNPNGRERQDRMCLCRFGTFDMSDPSKSTLLSEKSLLGTAAMPADIADKYFPAIANNPDLKALMLGGYHGVAPGFGLYMAGVTAHGNRLFILSQSHLYCIGSEALGSPKDDPAIIAAIAAAKNATELTKYLQTERPRYRRDALLGLANLKLPLNAEQQKQVQDLMINDPFEEVRAASILALDVEKDAGAKQFLNAFIKAQKAKKPSEEDKLTSVMLLTAQELGATYFQDRLPVALVANKEFVARQALFMIASNVRLFTPPIIEAAMETLKEPNFITPRTERIHVLHQQNVADYLGLASAKDPRTMTALRKSGLDPVQLMPVLCHRLPIEELPSFIDEMVRSGKNMGYVWSQGSQASWFSRICYRMGPAKAIPVLEKLKTDKPDMAGQLQDIINGLTAK